MADKKELDYFGCFGWGLGIVMFICLFAVFMHPGTKETNAKDYSDYCVDGYKIISVSGRHGLIQLFEYRDGIVQPVQCENNQPKRKLK